MNEWILTSSDARVWHLRTPGSSYIVGLDAEGTPVQKYWGATLPAGVENDFAPSERTRMFSSFQRPSEIDEQLPVDGGVHWGVPSLQVVFAGGVRSVELSYERSEVVGRTLTLHLVDRSFGLQVELRYTVHQDSNVIERWVTVANGGPEPIQILRADSANWVIPDQTGYRQSTAHGYWAGENQLERREVGRGEHTIGSRHGTTGHQSDPWVMIDDGTATEQHGEVHSLTLAWSGSWRITTTRRAEGGVSITGGFGHDGLSWRLEPGERLETPRFLGLYCAEGFGGTSQAWHHYVRAHVLPRPENVRPIEYNAWEATWFDVTEENQSDLARRAAAIGVETFVLDDGWFGSRNSSASGLGDWTVNTTKFPNGVAPFVTTIRELGMNFGLWVEPEMVNPDSDLYREKPEWVLHWPGRRRDEQRKQLVLNFARPDVREWAFSWLSALVSEHHVDFLKWDMNRSFTQAGWPADPDRQDWVWIEHTRGVYWIMDELRRAHPWLTIESCAGGGGRVDLGILARTDQVWPSDATDALDRQVIQSGFSQIYPAQVMYAWVTDEVNPLTGRRIPLDYRFHVAMAGSMGLGGDLRSWSETDLARSAEHIEAYKRIRKTVQLGTLHRLGGEPGRDYSALQYIDEDQVVVLSYEPHRSLSETPRRLRLRGLDPNATYRDESRSAEYRGALLTCWGIPIVSDPDTSRDVMSASQADYSSALTVLRRLS